MEGGIPEKEIMTQEKIFRPIVEMKRQYWNYSSYNR